MGIYIDLYYMHAQFEEFEELIKHEIIRKQGLTVQKQQAG